MALTPGERAGPADADRPARPGRAGRFATPATRWGGSLWADRARGQGRCAPRCW
jgi:hypothetical protein